MLINNIANTKKKRNQRNPNKNNEVSVEDKTKSR